jgi:hypothetical protein
MNATTIPDAAINARSVATAANSLLRALRTDGDLDGALDRLELQAARSVGAHVQAFDNSATPRSEEEILAEALSQLGIGNTLLCAEAIAQRGRVATDLEASIRSLEDTADAIETLEAQPILTQGFDASPDGVDMGIADAASAALEEMAHAAGEVVTATLDKAFRPIFKLVPTAFTDLGDAFDIDIPGRLVRWGVRAVARGLDLVLQLVHVEAIERQRATVDSVLTRLGSGDDPAIIAGWFIGADSIRAELAVATDLGAERRELVDELVRLSARFVRLCRLLRRTALLVVGIAGLFALYPAAATHALVVTGVGLAIVLGTTIVLGRMYTGQSDLPGLRGVRLVLGAN